MADEKKKSEGLDWDPVEVFVVLIFILGIISTGLPLLWSYVTSGELTFYGIKISTIINFFAAHAAFFKFLGFLAAGAAAWGTFVLNKRYDAIWREEKAKVYPENAPEPVFEEPVKNPMTERWQKIVQKSESQNPSDWRLAIIEADIILDELLENLHLPGDTMGEKLKAVEKSDFTTIEYAWEAHKARNFIAHEGEGFLLSQRETRRIISLYEAVFKEFFLI
jgi:hypothetical protein